MACYIFLQGLLRHYRKIIEIIVGVFYLYGEVVDGGGWWWTFRKKSRRAKPFKNPYGEVGGISTTTTTSLYR
jgi:hypothetical protein